MRTLSGFPGNWTSNDDGKLLETTVLSVVDPDRLDAVVVLVTTSGNAYYGE